MLSVVAPAYDEADVLPSFVTRLVDVLEVAGEEWEVVLVDDGSRDGTWDAIEAAARGEPRIRGIRLSRNFGHQLALTAGLSVAAAIGIIYWLFFVGAARDWLLTVSLACVTAGIFGNLYDRLMFGFVVDFLHLHHWPVFNVADSCISIGAVLLDSPWSTAYNNFVFDEVRYPNPRGMIDAWHKMGIRTVLWLTHMINTRQDKSDARAVLSG